MTCTAAVWLIAVVILVACAGILLLRLLVRFVLGPPEVREVKDYLMWTRAEREKERQRKQASELEEAHGKGIPS